MVKAQANFLMSPDTQKRASEAFRANLKLTEVQTRQAIRDDFRRVERETREALSREADG